MHRKLKTIFIVDYHEKTFMEKGSGVIPTFKKCVGIFNVKYWSPQHTAC